ncbi:unnamed protein product [Mytilus coruscus]|uniref:Uncharacterized protein n=1 Tax=Mytilus coruscus TaxID=42192 RepID=A0A6J7ZWG9_MYTCO|nr:unnamed protein product [Mytilus coruscus]
MCTDKDDPNKEKNMAASYAEAAKGDKTQLQSYDDTMTGVNPIFLLEEDVFGNDLVNSNGQRYFLTHWEVYHAINEQVPVKTKSLEEGNSQNITKPSMSIEERKKSDNDSEQSQSILDTQESALFRKQLSQTPKSNNNTGHKESITRYLTTKGRDQYSTNNTHDTPKKSRNKNPNFEKSPLTPTENLHDATRETAAKKPKKK